MIIDLTEETFQTLVNLALLNDVKEAEVSVRIDKDGIVSIRMISGSKEKRLSLMDVSYIKQFADYKCGASSLYRLKLANMYEEMCWYSLDQENESES